MEWKEKKVEEFHSDVDFEERAVVLECFELERLLGSWSSIGSELELVLRKAEVELQMVEDLRQKSYYCLRLKMEV